MRVSVAVVLAMLLLTGAAPAAPQAAVAAADDAGHTVRLPVPARRIVSLAPHLTELLFAAGAGDQVVGVAAFSDFPEAARGLPLVGDSAQLDLERIVALRPDLIVLWGSGTPARQQDRLARLGVPVFASEVRRFEDIASTLRRLGALAGTAAAAAVRAEAFEHELARLRREYAGRPTLSAAYQIWPRPLMTVNGQHLISQALETCGARNVFAALGPLVPTLDPEAVVAADPDVIVAGRGPRDGPDVLATWRRLPALRATREGRLFTVDPDTLHRASDRVLEGTRSLCAQLDRARPR